MADDCFDLGFDEKVASIVNNFALVCFKFQIVFSHCPPFHLETYIIVIVKM